MVPVFPAVSLVVWVLLVGVATLTSALVQAHAFRSAAPELSFGVQVALPTSPVLSLRVGGATSTLATRSAGGGGGASGPPGPELQEISKQARLTRESHFRKPPRAAWDPP